MEKPGQRPGEGRTTYLVFTLSSRSVIRVAGVDCLDGAIVRCHDRSAKQALLPSNTTATNKAGMPALARACARWADSDGGLGDHPVTVLTCNDHNTSAGAAACARRAVAEKVVAVVGSYSQYGSAFFPPLEAAGIPFIGGFGLTHEEFSSSVSYPVNGGQPALLAGNGHQLGAACSKGFVNVSTTLENAEP